MDYIQLGDVMVDINPIWEPAINQLVIWASQPVTGNEGDITWATLMLVIVIILGFYTALGGKI